MSTIIDPLDRLCEEVVALNRRNFDYWIQLCESPIERMFIASAFVADWVIPRDVQSAYLALDLEKLGVKKTYHTLVHNDIAGALVVQPELRIGGRYMRLDFAMTHGPARIAVELDGHKWHETTKEQARKDKSRDRLLSAAGWTVLRFTGSEVYNAPEACFAEVMDTAQKIECARFEEAHGEKVTP